METNLAIENSKKRKTAFKNSDAGTPFDFTNTKTIMLSNIAKEMIPKINPKINFKTSIMGLALKLSSTS